MSKATEADGGRDLIGKVLGRTPSGVFVMTAADGDGHETGMLASWVQQAAFEPPMVSVAVNKSRYLHDWLAATGRAALSLIGESQGKFLKHFGKGFEPDADAFKKVEVARTESGLPVLAEALGWLEGEVAGSLDAGDHVVYLLRIEAAGRGAAQKESPMVHVRKSAFNY